MSPHRELLGQKAESPVIIENLLSIFIKVYKKETFQIVKGFFFFVWDSIPTRTLFELLTMFFFVGILYPEVICSSY